MNELWSVVTIVGLIGWLFSAMLLIFRAFPGQGRFEKRPALLWGGILVASYAVWIAGLLNA